MKLDKLNILFFTRTMKLGGTEKVVLQLCEILKPRVNKIIVCSCGGVNTEVLDRMGIKHYEIPDIEDKSPSTIASVFKTVKKIIKNEQINVIHTHHRMAAFYTKVLFFTSKFTFINTSHNTFNDKRAFTRFAYKNANLIACGEMVKRNLVQQYGIPESQVTVIHNAVEAYDGSEVIIEELRDLRTQGYSLVGNVGRLSEQKGMEYFLRSLPKVKEVCPKVKYVIVGDGEDRNKLESLTIELGIEKDVIFLGYRSDIRNVMCQLDFIVLSSLWEGLPLTPIEAFSVGKTVIATAVDGSVEIVNNNRNGFLVSPRNSDEIADRVIELINNPKLRKAFEIEATKTYNQEFSFTKYSERVIEYYSKL
mgnify:CR=1 FL=1